MRLGGKLRRLRQDNKLTQVQMAERLAISGSYLNLLEHNQRPVTVPILLKLAEQFRVELTAFTAEDDSRLQAALMELFADPLFDAHDVKPAEVADLVVSTPRLGRAMLALYQAWQRTGQGDPGHAPAGDAAGGDAAVPGHPAQEVADFVQARRNHFPDIELAAETARREAALDEGRSLHGLSEHLAKRYAVDLVLRPAAGMGGARRRYDPRTRQLAIAESLPEPSRAFQAAHQLALLSQRGLIDRLIGGAKLTSDEADMLARRALAGYFAAALLMPYEPFLEAARASRYDIDALAARFGVSFEQAAQRLTSLNRPGAAGVPFHLLRVDRAGTIEKRFGGSGLAIPRFGAACARWALHQAFLAPGLTHVQLSRFSDGKSYICLARTLVPHDRPGDLRPRKALAIGCDADHAPSVAFADGLEARAPVAVGSSCRVCDLFDCADRSAPAALSRPLLDENWDGPSPFAGPRPEGTRAGRQ
ncbi:MAG: DUF2083 domain-containing protein [Alphaproteobacteria bacterium]|nr:DUF2083 domain-containing protein [Alphaproteobacteria bacterium]